MGATEVGKDALFAKGGVFSQTLRDLRKQQESLNRQLQRVEKSFLKAKAKAKTKIKKTANGEKKKYVARMENKVILRDAIRKGLIPGRETTMKQVLKTLKRRDLYRTRSKLFYTMVNNKLNRDPLVKKVSRGVFVLKKRTRQRRKAS